MYADFSVDTQNFLCYNSCVKIQEKELIIMSATYILSKSILNYKLNRRNNDQNKRKKELRYNLYGEDR